MNKLIKNVLILFIAFSQILLNDRKAFIREKIRKLIKLNWFPTSIEHYGCGSLGNDKIYCLFIVFSIDKIGRSHQGVNTGFEGKWN